MHLRASQHRVQRSSGFTIHLIDSPQGMRAYFLGRSGEDEVGLTLTAGSGVLSGLEVYTFGEVDHPFDLPTIKHLTAGKLKTQVPEKSGELNRSMQHWLAVYSPAFQSPRSFAGVD